MGGHPIHLLTWIPSIMPNPMSIRPRIASFVLAVASIALGGCGGGNSTSLPPPAGPVANPSADNKLKDITLENESANMDRIKKAGEGK
jgi:hypothetical protein